MQDVLKHLEVLMAHTKWLSGMRLKHSVPQVRHT